jgi:hypothetical protein
MTELPELVEPSPKFQLNEAYGGIPPEAVAVKLTATPTSLEPEPATVAVRVGGLMVMLVDADASLPLTSVAFTLTV